MEDLQLIIYIIFAVLYLIFKVMQKKKEPDQSQSDSLPENRDRRQKPQMTFEEMLREFSGETITPETRKEERVEVPQSPRRQEPVVQKERPREYVPFEQGDIEHVNEVYNQSVIRGQKAKTLDEQIDLENLDVGNVKLVEDNKEEKKKVSNEFIEAFQSIEGARKAFIYSEIINRKY